MNTPNDGGPAYPCEPEYKHFLMKKDGTEVELPKAQMKHIKMSEDDKGIRHEPVFEKGMSLRDYFAGQALAGFITVNAEILNEAAKEHQETPTQFIAATCYQLADAMLIARSK